jgi:hypothetical protein
MPMLKESLQTILKSLVRKSNRAEWHKLRSLQPYSRVFGFDRGMPIDRYYIEKFLSENRNYIKGTVLEVAESTYSKKFDNGVTKFEVLHNDPTFKEATITGDLSSPATLPENIADCFICTQTFNFIFDVQTAVKGTYKLLKPGGVLLATVAGLCPISRYDMDRWGDYWRFTDLSVRKAFSNIFDEKNIEVTVHGNVLSSTAIIQGISADELTKDELDFSDKDYQIVISIIARKPS